MNCCKCGKDVGNITETIIDANGATHYCPNCLCIAYMENELNFENNEDFVDDVTGKKGAVKFSSLNEEYVLEKESMLRLISYNLEPEEYFALAKKYGADKFMIHSDFYDDIDGEALQPLDDR